MPLYFFHLSNGAESLPDEEGVELAGVEAAHDEALAAARELTDADNGDRKRWSGWCIDIVDAAGAHLLKVDIWPARCRAAQTKLPCEAESY